MSAKTNSHLRVRMLCEGAMMVALAQVLSYIKLMELPNGGSLTPAMFPILLFAVRWGLAPGLMAGFTFGLLQLIFDGAYAWGWQSMLLDYLVAFTPLGLAGLFKGKKWGIFVGTVVGCLGRFIVHYISGVTIYKILAPTEFMKWTFTSPSAYSIVYNGSYMLPNLIITDGGQGQMSVVRSVVEDELHLQIPIAGLAKDNRHRTNELLYGNPPVTIAIKTDSELFRILTQIQDEVHRFAITFHRDKRSKHQLHSELDEIKGIGPKTKQLLLGQLKSVKRIQEASIDTLTTIAGKTKAAIIYQHFHPDNSLQTEQ